MEGRARRRMTRLSSHVNPTQETMPPACLSAFSCASHDSNGRDEVKRTEDCVFCKIIRSEASALKIIAAMCSKVPLISNAVMKATGCDSFNMLVNNGVAAGQVIFHTHIHIIPRKADDCLWASESLRRLPQKLNQEASQLAKCICENLSFDDFKGQASTLVGD